jgi:Ni,Fe-hydrogenase III small subunit
LIGAGLAFHGSNSFATTQRARSSARDDDGFGCRATPGPKWVVAVGDCARDGGCFAGSYAVEGGVAAVIPVDLHIAGGPPTPTAMLVGLLALLERAERASG